MVGSLKILEVFTTAFFVTNYYLNLNFFEATQSAVLKSKKKISKKYVSHLKVVWHSKRQKNIEKEKEKWQMRKSQTTKTNIF